MKREYPEFWVGSYCRILSDSKPVLMFVVLGRDKRSLSFIMRILQDNALNVGIEMPFHYEDTKYARRKGMEE